VFIPLFLTFWCLASVHAVLKLRPLLTFLHLYLALVSIISAGAAFVLKADPLTTFQNQDHETYIFTQGLMGVVFVFYCLLLVVAFLRSRNNTEWLIRVVQLAGRLITFTHLPSRNVHHPPLATHHPPSTHTHTHRCAHDRVALLPAILGACHA
jgi:hypothetical protein